jgi:putative ABC transport system ATP-binding protein
MIELKNIYKTYQIGLHQVHALSGVDINIAAGEFVSLMGASGSGKTTTMNILGLLDHPTSGEYYLNGNEVSQLNRQQLAYLRNRSIGFIFQSFYLLPRLNALQNVMLPLQYREEDQANIKELSIASLEKVGMKDYIEHRPNQLSGGQQQRVAIARALVTKPSIILADEPTGALDSKTGQEVMNLLMDIHRRENATVIIVTHDMQVASQCERIIKLKDGKLN